MEVRDYLMARYACEASTEIEALSQSVPVEDRAAFVARQLEMLQVKIEQLNRKAGSVPVEDDFLRVRIDRTEVGRIHARIQR